MDHIEYELTSQDFLDSCMSDLAQDIDSPHANTRLILGIIRSAAIEGDSDYFRGHMFKYHCMLVGLNHEVLLETIIRLKLDTIERKVHDSVKIARSQRDELVAKFKTGMYSKTKLAKNYNISTDSLGKILGIG